MSHINLVEHNIHIVSLHFHNVVHVFANPVILMLNHGWCSRGRNMLKF